VAPEATIFDGERRGDSVEEASSSSSSSGSDTSASSSRPAGTGGGGGGGDADVAAASSVDAIANCLVIEAEGLCLILRARSWRLAPNKRSASRKYVAVTWLYSLRSKALKANKSIYL